jgi:KaiC/GvpD/RAD55 family RecA-like ATPase
MSQQSAFRSSTGAERVTPSQRTSRRPEIEPGTNFFATGPTTVNKHASILEMICPTMTEQDALIFVTLETDPETVFDQIESVPTRGLVDNRRIAILDTCSTSGAAVDELPFRYVETVNSPTDLTGVFMNLNNILDRFQDSEHINRYWIVIDSITPLFFYRGTKEIFKFLHVLTRQISSIGGISFTLAHYGTGQESEHLKLEPLFDGFVEFHERDEELVLDFKGRDIERVSWYPH